ncbi:MAG: hypothetical protein M0Q53_00805 [Prolixibacteraceae bacterium]|jgi:hypothetical protein|nr:hypothetical protein [Prolixibacteraceae bacterium]
MSKQSGIEPITKPDYLQCIERIQAWFQGEILDRVPIRFHRHNAEYNVLHKSGHSTQKERWFDAEYQVDEFIQSIEGQRFNAETFPVYWPNLGPNVYAAFHGGEMQFEDTTSWYHEIINDYDRDIDQINFSKGNSYYKKLLELTKIAIEKDNNRYLVGYTDIHPGLDCVLAWRGSENLCMDLILEPDKVKILIGKSMEHFEEVYDDFDRMIKSAGMPSANWMNIPIPNGRMHIPSCDFAFMISQDDYNTFGIPILKKEVLTKTHNIFHVDGKGVANHIDSILGVPQIQAIQWVQGMGDDYPIMQHLDFIRYVQSKKKGIIVDLAKEDLDEYMELMSPNHTFLWIATNCEEEEFEIMKKVEKWR